MVTITDNLGIRPEVLDVLRNACEAHDPNLRVLILGDTNMIQWAGAKVHERPQNGDDYDVYVYPWGHLLSGTSATHTRREVGGVSIYDLLRTEVLDTAQYMCDDGETPLASAMYRTIVFASPLIEIDGTLTNTTFGEIFSELLPAAVDPERDLASITRSEQLSTWVSGALTMASSARVDDLRAEIDNLIGDLQDAQSRVVRNRNVLHEKQQLLDSALHLQAREITLEDVEREIHGINNNAAVRHTAWNDGALSVLTTEIPITNRDGTESADLGPYSICLKFEDSSVSIRNLRNPRGGFDHPHVRGNHFCAGEWQPTVTQLLRDGQVAACVSFVIACLGQVNHDDEWGRHSRWWFDEYADENRE